MQFAGGLGDLRSGTPEIRHCLDCYTNLPQPGPVTQKPWLRADCADLASLKQGTLSDWLGYLRSWSPFDRFVKKEGREVAERLIGKMEKRREEEIRIRYAMCGDENDLSGQKQSSAWIRRQQLTRFLSP